MSGAGPQVWVWYTPYGLGGVENYLLTMTSAALSLGGRPAVAATLRAEGRLRADYPTAVEQLDWTSFHESFMGRADPKPVAELLASDLTRVKPTLLVLNDCTDFALGALPLLKRMRPWCTLLDVLHIDCPDEGYYTRRRPLFGVLDGVVGTNQSALARLAAAGAACPLRFVRNGVRVSERPRLAGEAGRLRLLYVGRLEQAQKRVLAIPEVLGRLRALGRDFSLTLIGDGPERARLEIALTRAGLSQNVRFMGVLGPGETLDAYRDHDVLLSLSAYEGFSLALLEALAAGCVPVCTDLPSLDGTVFEHGVTCCVCPFGEPERMAETLAGLAPEQIERLSSNGRARAQELTPEASCRSYLDFVSELRRSRPLLEWPQDARQELEAPWDPTQFNPWLPRPGLLRRLGRALLGARP